MASSGVTNDCFGFKNMSPVHIGSAGSSTASAQYLAEKGAQKIVIVTSNAPGADLVNKSVLDFADSKGIASDRFLENVPITDANGLALKLVKAADKDGGVIVNFNPGDILKVFNAVT